MRVDIEVGQVWQEKSRHKERRLIIESKHLDYIIGRVVSNENEKTIGKTVHMLIYGLRDKWRLVAGPNSHLKKCVHCNGAGYVQE